MQEFSAADFFMVKLLVKHGLLRLIYEYATKEIYLIFVLLLINFILLWNKSDYLLDKLRLGIKNYYALRLLSLGVAILFSLKLFELALDKKSYFYLTIESIKSENKYYPRKDYGPFAGIIFTVQDIYIEPLHGKIDESLILDKINTGKAASIPNKTDMPDIIVILNESVFNPTKLDYDFADKFHFEFFQDNEYTKYSGILNVNTFGGSSWISEYEVNTGIPHKSFSGPSYMPFITLVPHTMNSIMSYLRSIGYAIDVLYPVDKHFSLAYDAYTKLGAHKITDIYEFGFKPKSWGEVPDIMIAEMIIDTLEKEPNQPKYIFAATMLNHGPHSSFFPDYIGCSISMNDQLCSKLNDYIARLSKTNEEQSELIRKLMNRKRKTIVVNFGDHLPSFEGFSTQLRFTRDIKNYFETFYNIHANFEIEDKTKYPVLDITFIPGLILDIAKLKGNNFYNANSLIRKKCHGQIQNCDTNPEYNKLLESYKSLITKQLSI